jgi:hypothetical protein
VTTAQELRNINTVAVLRFHGERGRRITKPLTPAEKTTRWFPPRAQLRNAFLTLPTSALACRDHFRQMRNAGQARGDGGYPSSGGTAHSATRSAHGPTAHEISPPCAAGPTKVCDRDIALDARAVGGALGSCLLIEFGEAAITSSPRGHTRCSRPRASAAAARQPHQIKVMAVLWLWGSR